MNLGWCDQGAGRLPKTWSLRAALSQSVFLFFTGNELPHSPRWHLISWLLRNVNFPSLPIAEVCSLAIKAVQVPRRRYKVVILKTHANTVVFLTLLST